MNRELLFELRNNAKIYYPEWLHVGITCSFLGLIYSKLKYVFIKFNSDDNTVLIRYYQIGEINNNHFTVINTIANRLSSFHTDKNIKIYSKLFDINLIDSIEEDNWLNNNFYYIAFHRKMEI